MEDNKILKLVYTFFLGILLAIFVGVGINTFYPPPPDPKWPIQLETYGKEFSEEQQKLQISHEKKRLAYEESLKPYSRNVSILTLAAAVTLLAVSILYEKKIKIIADGVMIGGLFTLLYSIGRGFASGDDTYVFVMVTVALAVVLYLGYHRFVKPDGNANAKKAKT